MFINFFFNNNKFFIIPGPELLSDIRRFNVFVVRVYLKQWFLCQVPTMAPANDLKLLKELQNYKEIDSEIGEVVQSKLRGHLWYLNESNIALAFFDDEVDIEMKRKMVSNLRKDGHPENPKRIKISIEEIVRAEICDFVTKNTYFFFDTMLNEHITGVNKSFLERDPITWQKDENYMAAKKIVKNLLLVNDIAERGVAVIKRFNPVLTHQEEQKQFIIATVEQQYKELPNNGYSKSKLVDYLNK